MSYRTSRTTPPATLPPSPSEWRIYFPYFVPTGIEVFLSGLTLDPDAGTGALNNDQVHYSNGSYDGTRQSCHTLFDDGTYRRSGLVNNRIMYFFEKVTGTTPVLKVEAKYIGYDTVNQELVFQMLKTSSNYQANIRAF